MATSNDDRPTFERLMARATNVPEASWTGPGDLGRASIEAMATAIGDVRDIASRGSVRLTGAGVQGHSADLAGVGAVAANWQRLVTAVGASLEGARSAKGPVSRQIAARTKLALQAAPAPGSIILNLSAASDPQLEASPGNQRAMFDSQRPLADRAVEALLGVMADASSTDLDSNDALAEELQALGPRVASAIRQFSDVAATEHFDVEMLWAEPAQPTRRASLTATTAGWLRDFVTGRDLDAVEEELIGIARTVSDFSNWVIEGDDGIRRVDASALGGDEVRQVRVGDVVRLAVLVRATARPDGTTTSTVTATALLAPSDEGDDSSNG